jgi:hypothetical protein
MRKALPNLPAMYKKLNREYFGGELPIIPVTWNPRLKRCLGRAFYTRKYPEPYSACRDIKLIPTKIDIMVNYPSARALRKTMVHEMCHVWEFIMNGDGGHNRFFWAKMKECGYPKGHSFPGDDAGAEADKWSESAKAFRWGDTVSFKARYRKDDIFAVGSVRKVNRKTCKVEIHSPRRHAGMVFVVNKVILSRAPYKEAGSEPVIKKPEAARKLDVMEGACKRLSGKRLAVWRCLRDNISGVRAYTIAWEVWPDSTKEKGLANAKCYISYLRKDGYDIVLVDGKYIWKI